MKTSSFVVTLPERVVKILAQKTLTLNTSIEEFIASTMIDSVALSGPTVKDIAQEACVSWQAVSYALNGHDSQISLETKKRILGIAKKMGYRPSQAARNLRKRRS